MSSSDRMLSLLSLFSVDRSVLTVEEAAEAIGASPRTTYRYFRSLASAGLLAPVSGGRYMLGPATVQLDWLVRNTDPLIGAAAPAMAILADAVPVPAVILLCRLYRDQVMCISQAEAGHPPFASSYQRGRLMPLFHGAASKAILASLPSRTARKLCSQRGADMAAGTLGTTVEAVQTSLAAIRAAGICVTHGELDVGLFGISVPLMGSEFLPAGSLSLVVADAGMTQALRGSLANLLHAGAGQVTATLQSI